MIFCSVENGIISIGFRKITSFVRTIFPDIEVCHVTPSNLYSRIDAFVNFGNTKNDMSNNDIKAVASYLAKADMICFSSMTPFADLTKKLLKNIHEINKNIFTVWGGIHPSVYPEDAIKSVDAICIGEGESAFKEFILAYKNGNDYLNTRNFWFNNKNNVIKNSFRKLQQPNVMENFPYPLYAENEMIYKKKQGFVPLTNDEYISLTGISYHTILAIGCPFKCTYCANSLFSENDPLYRKLRYPSVDYIIGEIKSVLKKQPYISNVQFMDDGFIALPVDYLREFSIKWKKEVDIPFSLSGVIPGYVRKEKMEILTLGGMIGMRMGIQSGSDRILKFYKRPNRPGLVMQTVKTISEYSKYMKPPAYDIILDNPIETKEDVIDTLKLLYDMPRPFVLQIYGLSVIPNTTLADDLKKLNVSIKSISEGYLLVKPTLANAMVYMLTVYKPSKWIFNFLLKYAEPYTKKQTQHYILLLFFRSLWLIKRGIIGVMHMDFTELPGKIGWLCWKLGIINFWRSTIQKKKFIKKPQALDQLLTKHKLKEKSYLIHGSGSHKHMEEIDRDLKKSKFI